MEERLIKEISEFKEGQEYTYREVEALFDRLVNINEYAYDSVEMVEGVLVDSYLLNVSNLCYEHEYVLFLETYKNSQSSVNKVYFVKDYDDLTERFPFVVEEIEREED